MGRSFSLKSSKKKGVRNVPRKFLTPDAKQKIEEIATILNHNTRQIKEYINIKTTNKNNCFSREEDEIVLNCVKKGLNSPGKISKIIGTKTCWMVRNRILYFKRRIDNLETIDIQHFLNQIHNTSSSSDSFDPFAIFEQFSESWDTENMSFGCGIFS